MLKNDLTALLNKYNAENVSNTPDWILADYLMGCLANYNHTLKLRQVWYEANNELTDLKLTRPSLPEQK